MTPAWTGSSDESGRTLGGAPFAATIVVAATVIVLTACGFDTDSLYGDATSSDGAGGDVMVADPIDPVPVRTRDIAYLPGVPDAPFEASCFDCAKTTCQHERTLCVADEQCYSRLWCADVCRDPNCLSLCEEPMLIAESECGPACDELEATEYEFCLAECGEPRERFGTLEECIFGTCQDDATQAATGGVPVTTTGLPSPIRHSRPSWRER